MFYIGVVKLYTLVGIFRVIKLHQLGGMDLMLNKKIVITEILFLLLVSATSIFYFDIGQWKAYVRLFAIIEILILLTTFIIYTLKIIKNSYISYIPLLFLHGILCVMQVFPMIGALTLSIYYKIAVIHHIAI